MIKKVVLVLMVAVILGGCGLGTEKSGIEIVSYPAAKVFIDGKEAGMTPYKNTTLKPGEVDIRLKTSTMVWERKIELKNNINTVIDWEFGKDEESSGGYVLSMEKTGDKNRAGLMVATIPDKSAMAIDNEIRGQTPIKLEDLDEGDRQVTISFPGNKTVNVFVKAVKGYKLIIEAVLAREELIVPPADTMDKASTTSPIKKMVVIKDTETGWLRVREAASNTAAEITKVKPGDKYEELSDRVDWLLINLGAGKSGWISAKYAEKI